MSALIEKIRSSEIFEKIDIYLADFIYSNSRDKSDIIYILVALLSYRIRRGDICLEIEKIAGKDLNELLDERLSDEIIKIPSIKQILSVLNKSEVAGSTTKRFPLILDLDRIYFEKYFFFEHGLAEMIKNKLSNKNHEADLKINKSLFCKLFAFDNEINWQAIAAISSLSFNFSVISGGPGTGKTSTVLKIIALMLDQNHDLKIALAAPTGKAASRLKDSIASQIKSLDIDETIAQRIPTETFTIHRLLGTRIGSHEFIHNKSNPLDYDVIVVDECSMADLALMYRLFSALKEDSKIILLGDRDQLASVEVGAVFGDICDRGKIHGYSSLFAGQICSHIGQSYKDQIDIDENATALADALTILKKSYRFGSDSGIGRLSIAVRNGDTKEIENLAGEHNLEDISIIKCDYSEIKKIYREKALNFTFHVGAIHEEILSFIKGCCILTATRVGIYGLQAMNRLAENILSMENIIAPWNNFYPGRPIMITSNDYNLLLFNGDIGVIASDGQDFKAIFERSDGSEFKVSPARLPEHETAFAMTVHKSQGSEFDEVIVVLPESQSLIMTRELLYTAITRAKKKVIIAADLKTIKEMSQRPMERMTGLRDRLWNL